MQCPEKKVDQRRRLKQPGWRRLSRNIPFYRSTRWCNFWLLALLLAGCATVPSHPPKAPADRAQVLGSEDVFTGLDRRDAKTSLASAGIESYRRIIDLRSTLKADEYMLSLAISESPVSIRSAEERRNVVVRGFIYAVKKESDNDFHLILGDRHCGDGTCLLTAEISGVPSQATNPSRNRLIGVRSQFLCRFSGREPGKSGYTKFDPPIYVTLTGSLFFDLDHKAGTVGPAGLKPATAWEIHPVSDITFQP